MSKKKKVYSDPIFGELTRGHHNYWDCSIDLSEDYSDIYLSIEGKEERPNQLFIDEAVKFTKEFESMLPAIKNCLNNEYQSYYHELEKEGWHEKMPSPNNIDINDLFSLIHVIIGNTKSLTFCFTDSLDDSIFEVCFNEDGISCAYIGD